MKLYHISERTLLSAMLAIILTLFACSQQPDSENDGREQADEKENTENRTDGIRLSQAQIDAVGIKLGRIEMKNLRSVVKASGQLAVPPQNRADVTLLMGGVVKQVFVLEGQHVSKGQRLASVENNQLIQMQQDYMSALSALSYATKEYERQRELNEANAGTGKIFQQSESAYRTEKARVAALAGQLKQIGISPAAAAKGSFITLLPVYAPISGTVGKISVQTGSFVEPARVLMNIVDNSKVHCDLFVYEKDLFKVKAGQTVNFILTNQDNREITGEIYGVNQSFENDSKAIIAHAVIRNAERNNLIEGMYVSARIDVGRQKIAAVPSEAIVKTGGKQYLYYLIKVEEKSGQKQRKTGNPETNGNADKTYVFGQAEVVPDVTDLGFTGIRVLAPLPADVKIVTTGAFYILSSQNAAGDDD